MSCSYKFGRWTESNNLIIQTALHHRHNPIESKLYWFGLHYDVVLLLVTGNNNENH